MTTGAIGGEDAVSDWETQDGSPVRGAPLHLRKILLPTKVLQMRFLGHILENMLPTLFETYTPLYVCIINCL